MISLTNGQSSKKELLHIILSLCTIAVIIIPFLILAQYTNPAADDFSNANNILSLGDEFSVLIVFKSAWNSYMSWQGTYFGNILAYLNPFAFFGVDSVAITTTLAVALLLISIFALIRSIVRWIFEANEWSLTLWIYAGIIFLITQFLNPAEFLYWYTGIAMYTIPCAFMLVGFACLILAYKAKKRNIFWAVTSTVLLFLACGGALIMSAFISLVLLILAGKSFYEKSSDKLFLMLFAIVVVGAFLNALAPGNFARQEIALADVEPISFKRIVWITIEVGTNLFTEYLPLSMIALVLIMLLFPTLKIVRKSSFSYRYSPVLLILLATLSYFVSIFPFVYGLHFGGVPYRYLWVVNIIAILMILFIFLYSIGWAVQNHKFSIVSGFEKSCIVILVFIALTNAIYIYPVKDWNSSHIVNNLANHTIQQSKFETMRILNEIRNSENDVVLVAPPSVRYPLLTDIGLSELSTEWVNVAVAIYYGKESVGYLPAASE